QDRVKLNEQDSSQMTSLLMSNGVRITAPLGKLTQVADSLLNDSTDQTHNLFSSASKDHKIQNYALATGGSAFFGMYEGDLNANYDYNNLNEAQQQQVRDTFKRDVQDAKKMISGDIPIVTAMKFDQLQE